MSILVVVALVAYASIVRPVLNEGAVDVHLMWVWQVVGTLLAIVPPWVPGWKEFTFTACVALVCIDATTTSRYVRDVVFTGLRNRLGNPGATIDRAETVE